MSLLRLSTQIHKWVGLVVGIQVLFWVAGGVVMTVLPIETVRSEHHLAEVKPAPLPMDKVLGAAEAAHHAGVTPVEAHLRGTPRGPVWTFKAGGEAPPVTVAATTGLPLPALAGKHQADLRVRHDHHGFELAQSAIRPPILGEFDRGAHQLARILFELLLEPVEQREGVSG